MCAHCGCSGDDVPIFTDLQTGEQHALEPTPEHRHVVGNGGHSHFHADGYHHHHDHDHDHDHQHAHDHDRDPGLHGRAQVPVQRAIGDGGVGTRHRLEQEVLARNGLLAERNRGWFAGRRVLALNLVSAPGAGKTTLLERTIRELGAELPIHVIEGDQATLCDAERIRAAGARVVQINTGTGCHLDADMTARGLQQLDPPAGSIVLIENVGNLVCPALFDLGEHARVLIASVTDGDDKPLKYPHMFRTAGLLLINKIDLIPHVPFDHERFLAAARLVNPQARVLDISATRGDGLEAWYDWLRQEGRSPKPDSQNPKQTQSVHHA